jgi:hypothetical protein
MNSPSEASSFTPRKARITRVLLVVFSSLYITVNVGMLLQSTTTQQQQHPVYSLLQETKFPSLSNRTSTATTAVSSQAKSIFANQTFWEMKSPIVNGIYVAKYKCLTIVDNGSIDPRKKKKKKYHNITNNINNNNGKHINPPYLTHATIPPCPSVIVAGTQKSGTTAIRYLWTYIHPQFLCAKNFETHFFDQYVLFFRVLYLFKQSIKQRNEL